MKSRIFKVLLTLGAALWLTIALHGQTPTPGGYLFKVDVPFSFVASGVNLPAGHYAVSHFPNSDWILLTSDDGRAIAMQLQIMVSSAPRGQSSRGKLVFNRYGENYFLAQVWTPSPDWLGARFSPPLAATAKPPSFLHR